MSITSEEDGGRDDRVPPPPSLSPKMRLEEAYLDADAPAASSSRAEHHGGVRATVLIVSAEPDLRRYVGECLRDRSDLWVIEASTVRAAVALADATAPDLLVVDGAARAPNEVLTSLPAIVIVDDAPREVVAPDARLRWLSRPFSAAQLLAEVAALIR